MKNKILLVEDDPTLAELLSEILNKTYNVSIKNVTDNVSAFNEIKKGLPDIVISDVYHLGENGVALFKSLRSNPVTSRIPIIMMSGSMTIEQELYFFRKKADGVLRKPFSVAELIECFDRILDVKENPEVKLLNLGIETRDIDYKENIRLYEKHSRSALAKDVISMANSGGGTIILGVKESKPGAFELIGIPKADLNDFETTRVNDALKKYVGSVVYVNVKRIEYKKKHYVFINVLPTEGTIAMACCNDERVGLYQGRIYHRTNAGRSEEVRDSIEVIWITDRIILDRIKKMPLIKTG
jgi:CheY-like chemotaxis protein